MGCLLFPSGVWAQGDPVSRQHLGCAKLGHPEAEPRAPQGIAAARDEVPSPHPPSQADTRAAALPAPLISPQQAPASSPAHGEATLSHGHVSIRQPALLLGRSGGVLMFLWESCAVLVGSDFPPYDRVF